MRRTLCSKQPSHGRNPFLLQLRMLLSRAQDESRLVITAGRQFLIAWIRMVVDVFQAVVLSAGLQNFSQWNREYGLGLVPSW